MNDDDDVKMMMKRLQCDIRAGFAVLFFLLVLLIYNSFHILSCSSCSSSSSDDEYYKHGKQNDPIEMQAGRVSCVASGRIEQ